MEVDGKVVFITGGARGIGLDTAQRLHARGSRVVIVDVDTAHAGTQAGRLGSRALGLGCDVSNHAQLDMAVEQAIATSGGSTS